MKNLLLILCLYGNTWLVNAGGTATFVGRSSCQSCHQKQDKLWQNSHHDLAMQHANNKTVLADFSDTKFTQHGITSTFFIKDNKYMVNTDGIDGKMQDYEIKYTFGVTPLQQYLIEFKDGRLQALSIAWDSRSKPNGGQHWFHLYPDEKITYQDEMHWTRNLANWNGMCADCHSTKLEKKYNEKDNIFKTSWSEIDVSCEACHGPASKHLKWAKSNSEDKHNSSESNHGFDFSLDEREGVSWNVDNKSGTFKRSQKKQTHKEIEMCAQCHSRRSPISDNYKPGKSYNNHFMPSLLEQGLYHSDGQIQGEVYVYGSFLQSKMYHSGVTCSDCHEPHSLKLRQKGNGVCLQCHSSEKFNTTNHHFHKQYSTGASCIECHMPAQNFMVVDPRHDHSFRIPRPDVSEKTGTPNACTNCHQEKSNIWASKMMQQWYKQPKAGFQGYGQAIDASRKGEKNAPALLSEQIQETQIPNIAKAAALSAMRPYLSQDNIGIIYQGLQDENSMVRLASVSALEGLSNIMLVQLVLPLLDDPVKSVRIEAARVMASIPVGNIDKKQLEAYNRATADYINSQLVNADLPRAQLNLAHFYQAKGDNKKALEAYQKAVIIDDSFIPTYINLADFYRQQNNEIVAEEVLKQAITQTINNADLYYALGLSLIRQNKKNQATKSFKKAKNLAKNNSQYVYVYAISLNGIGEKKLALSVLEEAHLRFQTNMSILQALVAYHKESNNEVKAKLYKERIQDLQK